MKNLLYLFFALFLIFSCNSEPQNHVKLSGKITQLEDGIDSIFIFIPNGYEKRIAIDNKGNFKDTLRVKEGKYQFRIGDEYGTIYLKNKDKIHLTSNYKDFDRELSFSGHGSSVTKSKVETELLHLNIKTFNEEAANLPDDEFEDRIAKFREAYAELKQKYSDIDASFWKDSDVAIESDINNFRDYKAQKNAISAKFNGKASPSFTYENIEGKNVSLKDLEGKYVYMDIWATWCGPCKREIPALKALEKKYEGKNIQFVSISVDKLADKEKWQKFVQKEQLTGIQLFADNDWESEFIKAYEIQGIPRFILLDPEGIIVNADAPRPSDPKLEKLFQSLGI